MLELDDMNMLIKKGGIMRKRILIGLFIACLLLAAGAVYYAANKQAKENSDGVQKAASKNKTDPAPALTGPEKPRSYKDACTLLDAKTAETAIGTNATISNIFSIGGLGREARDYTSTSCQYTNDNKTVTVTLYEYPTTKGAQAGKENAQTQQLVIEDGGTKTSIQPKSSSAQVRDNFVVTVTVIDNDKFDSAKSNQVLKDIMEKL